MATWNNISSQDASSPLMEQLLFFHDHTLIILLMITIIVSYIMVDLFNNKLNNRLLMEGQTIELIWTILPALTLIFIAFPSLRILYLLDEINSPLVTLKTIGHQWYWSYEYTDFKNIEFDSFMNSDSSNHKFRLIDVDTRSPLPLNSQIRIMVTAADVIHSWAIPSMGVKIDATPGRINQTNMIITRPGLFFGQCSEICGANHSFMPIVIESLSPKNFIKWLTNNS
uniref:Cytochrome c oxidase subunit 2 n=1 Tax=Drilonius striatulus TaxID=341977 RepID=A0A0S2MR92_9COLE|nr:cytochrome c oxidase subunit 2 [Drilonius striatulus]